MSMIVPINEPGVKKTTNRTSPKMDIDSATLLRDDFKVARAQIFAKMMTPTSAGGSGLSLSEVVRELDQSSNATNAFLYYDKLLQPDQVSAEMFHWHTWDYISEDHDLHELDYDHAHLKELAEEKTTIRSPEYQAYFMQRKEQECKEKFRRMDDLVKEYQTVRDIPLIIFKAWTTAVDSEDEFRVAEEWLQPYIKPVEQEAKVADA